jgi:hypothetical protein
MVVDNTDMCESVFAVTGGCVFSHAYAVTLIRSYGCVISKVAPSIVNKAEAEQRTSLKFCYHLNKTASKAYNLLVMNGGLGCMFCFNIHHER